MTAMDPSLAAAYGRQILAMAHRAQDWLLRHPEATPIVGYGHRPEIVLCASVHDALQAGLVELNPDAAALVAHICEPWEGTPRASTILMVRSVLDVALQFHKAHAGAQA